MRCWPIPVLPESTSAEFWPRNWSGGDTSASASGRGILVRQTAGLPERGVADEAALELAEALDLAANALADRPPRPPRNARAAILGRQEGNSEELTCRTAFPGRRVGPEGPPTEKTTRMLSRAA